MIYIGACVSSEGSEEALPMNSVMPHLHREDVVRTVTGAEGICAAYNVILDEARRNTHCQAIVLMHQDVQVIDNNFRAKVLAELARDCVGIIGVVGGAGLRSLAWWTARRTVGRLHETRGHLNLGEPTGDVDVVDGLFLALSPRVFRDLSFDSKRFPRFHGYDIDYCLQVRSSGYRVRVASIDLIHRTKTGLGDANAFKAAAQSARQKWPRWIRPSPLLFAKEHLAGAARHGRRLVRKAAVIGSSRSEQSRDADLARPHPSSPTAVPEKCPVCEGRLEHVSNDRVSIARCMQCSLGVTCPTPRRDAAAGEIWESTYRGKRLANREQWYREASKRIDWIHTYRPDGMLLEIGGGTGEFVAVAAQAGFEAYGVEVSEWAAGQARQLGVDVVAGYLSDWTAKYPGYSPDVVCMWHVLEHVPAPVTLLKQARDLLRDESLLFIEVPNLDSCDARRLGVDWVGADLHEHCCHFSPKSMQAALSAAGLSPVSIMPIPRRVYDSCSRWQTAKAEALLAGHEWPAMDLLRVVAHCQRREV